MRSRTPRIGRRPKRRDLRRRTGRRTLARLTRRELQVADLVAAGHSNREIGGELFLSVKTVERHLARIFGKLDITTRSKLAAMIAGDSPES